jgi:hypothetical protein
LRSQKNRCQPKPNQVEAIPFLPPPVLDFNWNFWNVDAPKTAVIY